MGGVLLLFILGYESGAGGGWTVSWAGVARDGRPRINHVTAEVLINAHVERDITWTDDFVPPSNAMLFTLYKCRKQRHGQGRCESW